MKKQLAFLCAFLSFSLIVHTSASLGKVLAGPRLVIKEKTHDYGAVRQGVTIEHVFKVNNEGDAPLEIKRVSPD